MISPTQYIVMNKKQNYLIEIFLIVTIHIQIEYIITLLMIEAWWLTNTNITIIIII